MFSTVLEVITLVLAVKSYFYRHRNIKHSWQNTCSKPGEYEKWFTCIIHRYLCHAVTLSGQLDNRQLPPRLNCVTFVVTAGKYQFIIISSRIVIAVTYYTPEPTLKILRVWYVNNVMWTLLVVPENMTCWPQHPRVELIIKPDKQLFHQKSSRTIVCARSLLQPRTYQKIVDSDP